MIENWKTIIGYGRKYEVSDLGRVMSVSKRIGIELHGRVLKTTSDRQGYPGAYLYRDGIRQFVRIHRLVARAFHGECPAGKEVNHLNGNKADPRAANLEYTSRSGNMIHAYRVLGRISKGGGGRSVGERNGKSKLTAGDVLKIRELLAAENQSQQRIADRFGIVRSVVSDISTGKLWGHV